MTLVNKLTRIVGEEHVVTDRRLLRIYRGGPWSYSDGEFGQTPLAAVKPGDAAQVAACLREIGSAGHPAVPLGGATGVTGGGAASADAVVIDLARLTEMSIDRASRRARVGAAIRLTDVAEAAGAERLLFAHDPWSQPLASVGGAIATNGVGYLAAGYGSMGAQVLGVQVALATGEVLDLPTALTTSSGPDLSRLFVGSEGTLGVITAATVRLFPMPERWTFIGQRFPVFADGFAALQAAADLGVPLAMIDYEEDEDGTAILYAAVHGLVDAVDIVAERFDGISEEHRGVPLPEGAVGRFWRERHESAHRYTRQLEEFRAELLSQEDEPGRRPRRDGWRYLHLALPAGAVLEFHGAAAETARSRGVRLHGTGIWGAPDLLSFMLSGPRGPTDALAEELQIAAARLGGSVEYCHGIGLRLARLMPAALGPALPVLGRIKRALDPAWLLNPGKQGLIP